MQCIILCGCSLCYQLQLAELVSSSAGPYCMPVNYSMQRCFLSHCMTSNHEPMPYVVIDIYYFSAMLS